MKEGLHIQIDDEARLLTITVAGDVHDDRALRDIPRIWREHPQIVGYDSLLDLRQDGGRLSWKAIHNIAWQWNHFSAGRDHGRRTAVVVRNDQWEAYSRAIATMFPERVFKVYRSPAEARHWLGGSDGA